MTRYLSKEDVQRAVSSAKQRSPIDLGLVCGIYYAMLREKEIRRLTHADCSFIVDNDGVELLRVHVKGKGRDEKERDVSFGRTGTDFLKAMVVATKPDAYLFPGQAINTSISSTSVWRRVKAVFKDARVTTKANPHWLRHAGASHAHKAGATLVEIRDMLGHLDVKATSRYLHSDPGSTTCSRALD